MIRKRILVKGQKRVEPVALGACMQEGPGLRGVGSPGAGSQAKPQGSCGHHPTEKRLIKTCSEKNKDVC